MVPFMSMRSGSSAPRSRAVATFWKERRSRMRCVAWKVNRSWSRPLSRPGGNSHAVTRREKGGSLTPANAATALADFHHDFAQQYFVIEVSRSLDDRAALLARKHTL